MSWSPTARTARRSRPENGYPLRLIVPGLEGNVNVKWLRRITVGGSPLHDPDGRTWTTLALMPDGKARQLQCSVMEAKSVITFPRAASSCRGRGSTRSGAWRGRVVAGPPGRGLDGRSGKTRRDARLQEPVLPLAPHALPARLAVGSGARPVLQSRCTDETGYVQPTLAELVKVRGLNSIVLTTTPSRAGRWRPMRSVHNVHARLWRAASHRRALWRQPVPVGAWPSCDATAGRPPTAEEVQAWDLTIPARWPGPAAGQRDRRTRPGDLTRSGAPPCHGAKGARTRSTSRLVGGQRHAGRPTSPCQDDRELLAIRHHAVELYPPGAASSTNPGSLTARPGCMR